MDIKKNFLYSSLLTASNYVFPLITFPYVSRVLGVENLGIYNFVDGIVNYCILFSMLGINTLGIRTSAKFSADPKGLNAAVSSLYALNLICTVIVLAILAVCTLTVPQLSQYKMLMVIGGMKVIGTTLVFDWFFKGIEDFKYVTQRAIIIKALYVVAVLLFINQKEDYVQFYFISTMMVVGNAILSCVYIRRRISFNFAEIDIKPYLGSFITLGVYMLLTSMYTSFNVAFLGFSAGEREVGYYTTSTKIYSIILSLFTAFTGVMLPRISALVSEQKFDEVRRLTTKSYDILFTFSIPIIIVTFFFAAQIVRLISGPGYEGAVFPMRLLAPLLLIIGVEQILIIQLLMPLKKDRAILINSIAGCICGVVLNILLVPTYKSAGSSIVWFASEFVVLLSAQYFGKKYFSMDFPFTKLAKHILFSLPIVGICFGLKILLGETLIAMTTSILVSAIYFIYSQVWLVKNETVISILSSSLESTRLNLAFLKQGSKRT